MENISKYRGHISVGVVSLGVGVVVGFFLGKRKGTPNYQVIPAQDWSEVLDEEDQDVSRKAEVFVQEKLTQTTVIIPEPEETDVVEAVTANVFAHNDEDWDYAAEMEKRSDKEPYILHKDEFYAEETEYLQATLTYYSGDNILSDSENVPVYNHHQVVGELRFGHGSGDANVVYIRNDKLRTEYEVLFDPGTFTEEVLGLEIEDNARVNELKHSGVPKFYRE